VSRVFEAGGVFAGADPDNKGWVRINERGSGVDITCGGYCTVQMSPDATRRLARQLHRFAGRVDNAGNK
jgi:hypothetical protein